MNLVAIGENDEKNWAIIVSRTIQRKVSDFWFDLVCNLLLYI